MTTTKEHVNPLMSITAELPTYSLQLPISKTKIKYRPFRVKEQKSLLLALESTRNSESESNEQILDAVIGILNDCTISPKTFNVREIPILDVEYLFLFLRAKSVGENIDLIVPDYTTDDAVHELEHSMDIEKITIVTDEEHSDKIKLDNDIVVEMTPPTLKSCSDLFFTTNSSVEQVFDVMASCIKSITTPEHSFFSEDMDKKDIEEYIETLTQEEYLSLASYFNTLPSLKYESTIKSPNTGKDVKVLVTEFSDFFV